MSTALETQPLYPKNLRLASSNSTALMFAWDRAELNQFVTGYKCKLIFGRQERVVEIPGADNVEVSFTGLTQMKLYAISVAFMYTDHIGSYSPPVFAKTLKRTHLQFICCNLIEDE